MEDRENPDGAPTITITSGTAPDGGISMTLSGSMPIIRSGRPPLGWIRAGLESYSDPTD